MSSNMLEVHVLFDGFSVEFENGETEANCTCTLIKGARNIIVDTMTAWDRDRLVEALRAKNLEPVDIHYVVCSHGHSDHIGNNNLFLDAEHIVGYDVHRGTTFYSKNIEEENYQLCEGVRVTATPGHTYSDVTVLVDQENGAETIRYAITGDLFERLEDITEPKLWQNVGTPALRQLQASNRLKILKTVDYVIPGHGPMFKSSKDLVRLLEDQIAAR